MLLYFKTKTCIQIEHSNIKLIFITYLYIYAYAHTRARTETRRGQSGDGANLLLFPDKWAIRPRFISGDCRLKGIYGSLSPAARTKPAGSLWHYRRIREPPEFRGIARPSHYQTPCPLHLPISDGDVQAYNVNLCFQMIILRGESDYF